MASDRWDPFRDVVSLSDAFGSLLRESFVRPGVVPTGAAPGTAGAAGIVALPLDVAETENEFVVRASLPGLAPDDVQITAHGDTLTIRGELKAEAEKPGETWHLRERRTGAFQRTVALPAAIDADRAHAAFEHGVLTLTLPKAETAKPKQIRINQGTAGGPAGPIASPPR